MFLHFSKVSFARGCHGSVPFRVLSYRSRPDSLSSLLTLYCGFGSGRREQTHRPDHEVLKHSVGRLGALAHIFVEARDLCCISLRSVCAIEGTVEARVLGMSRLRSALKRDSGNGGGCGW